MSGWVVITDAPVCGCVSEERGDGEGAVSQELSTVRYTWRYQSRGISHDMPGCVVMRLCGFVSEERGERGGRQIVVYYSG